MADLTPSSKNRKRREAARDLAITRAMVAVIEQQTGYDAADEEVLRRELALLRRAVAYMEDTGRGLPHWARGGVAVGGDGP